MPRENYLGVAEDILARRKRFVCGRVPVSSGTAARAQEICETVKELDCSLPMADVCAAGYSIAELQYARWTRSRQEQDPATNGVEDAQVIDST